MSNAAKRYVDIRIHFTEDVEEFKDQSGNVVESYTSHDIDFVERKKIKGISEDDLSGLGDSFGQMDAYHLFFQGEFPSVISDGNTVRFRK